MTAIKHETPPKDWDKAMEAALAEAERPDVIPTVDALEPEASYKDWRDEDTRVMVYTTAPEKFPRDRPCLDLLDARAQCQAIHGRILKSDYVTMEDGGMRMFFRVARVRRVK